LPGPWPGPHVNRARALVLCRMGHHAANAPDTAAILQSMPFHLRELLPERPPDYQPNAEASFRQALELAPDLLEPYDELFRYCLDTGKKAKAVTAGHKLLERFPDHLPALVALAKLQLEQGKPAEAVALFQRALKLNPLDRRLR